MKTATKQNDRRSYEKINSKNSDKRRNLCTIPCIMNEADIKTIKDLNVFMTEEQAIATATLQVFSLIHPAREFKTDMPGCTKKHIMFILEKVINGEVTGSKANRYIGWTQGIMCLEEILSLEDARNMNRRAIENTTSDVEAEFYEDFGW